MAKSLVIVESPAKAKTIERFLGKKYMVKASMGHLRDLPKSKLGISIENDFEPKYITIRGKGDIVKELKDAAKKSSKVYLATDPDREGEAISWHLAHLLKLDLDAPCRVSINEITESAVKEAFENISMIHKKRVDSQQARRILDRLVGYQLSPLLWKKIKKGLSAGRVQSVAVRLVYEREEEIEGFIVEEYWHIKAVFQDENEEASLEAKLIEMDGEKIDIAEEKKANEIADSVQEHSFKIHEVKKRKRRRNPASPFITSTFQQEASRKLGFGARKAMMLAQQLYEGIEIGEKGRVGLITYMRTDSTRVSSTAVEAARKWIEEKYDKNYLGTSLKRKSSGRQQDAHEAIRPSYPDQEPKDIKKYLSKDQWKVYKLIWERFMASQMSAAEYDTVTLDLKGGPYLFRVSGSVIKFAGFTALYIEGSDEEEQDEELELPKVKKGQPMVLDHVEPTQHYTKPPSRYTEASLVKEMEEKGIGRPSTYAPTIETIRQRGYVYLEEKKFHISELGRIVTDVLVEYFEDVMDVTFTAHMEDQLDKVEEGEVTWREVLKDFYQGFDDDLALAEKEMEEIEIEDEVTDEVCEKCGEYLVVKWGRYGKFLACPGFPDCRNTKPFHQYIGVDCPECKDQIVEKMTKKGRRFYGCAQYPDCTFTSWDKPTDKKCPDCDSYMVEKNTRKKGTFIRCSDKNCAYEETLETERDNENEVKE